MLTIILPLIKIILLSKLLGDYNANNKQTGDNAINHY